MLNKLILSALLVFSGRVFADTVISQTVPIGSEVSAEKSELDGEDPVQDEDSGHVSFAQFNPALGTLNRVTVQIVGGTQLVADMTVLGDALFSFSFSGGLGAIGPNFNDSTESEGDEPAVTSVIDTGVVEVASTPYVGTGMIDVPYHLLLVCSPQFDYHSPPYTDYAEGVGQLTCDVIVKYYYTPAH